MARSTTIAQSTACEKRTNFQMMPRGTTTIESWLVEQQTFHLWLLELQTFKLWLVEYKT
jgi:hypothetical protein